MTSPRSPRQRLPLAAAVGLVAASTGVLLPSLSASAAPASALTTTVSTSLPSAEPVPTAQTATTADTAPTTPAPAPSPDALDVTFEGGVAAESTGPFPARTWGAPTFSHDTTLNAPIMSTDGVDDAVSFAGFADRWAGFSQGYSIECVFRIDTTLPVAKEMDLCSDKQAGGFSVYVSGSNLSAMAHIDGAYRYTSTPIDGQRWYHALSVWDGTELKLYLNGVLVSSTPAAGALTPPVAGARHFVVGGDADVDKVAQWSPPASFARASVFSRGVDQDEARALAAQWKVRPTAPTADILDVDFVGGGTVDHAQNLAVTPFGDPQVVAEEALGQKVATFNGSSDALSYAFGEQWTKIGQGFSLECNFKFNGTTPTGGEKAVCSDKEAGGLATVVNGENVTFMAHIGGGYKNVTAPIVPGRWYHTVATWDGAALKLYLDGVLVDTIAATGTLGKPTGSAPTAFMLGADTGNTATPQFHGASSITSARVFGRAVSAEEVQALNLDALGDPRDAGVALRSTVPAAGQKITRAIGFDLDVKHAGAATGWTYLLDGKPVQPGQRIGGGLRSGSHTLEISATDVFGKALQWRVPFTSTTIPTGGGTDIGQGQGRVTLSAIANAPDNGTLTTTFTADEVTSAEGGFQGVVAVRPTTLDFTHSQSEPITGTALPDSSTMGSPSTGQLPFQRFDVPVTAFVEGQRISWSGVVDPDRMATLEVWDTSAREWVNLASSRGTADGSTVLNGELSESHVDDGTVHVMVLGEDPFADDLSPRDSSASDTKDSFENPDDYDFSFAHFTDTQYLAEGAVGGTYNDWDGVAETSDTMTAVEQAAWARAYRDTTDWIRDNADERKIAFTAHTGDVTENDYNDPLKKGANGALLWPGLDEQVTKEFEFTSGAHETLDDSGLVNQVIAGNHDNQMGAETGQDSRFSSTFSAQRYYRAAEQWPAAQKASFHPWDETLNEAGQVTQQGSDSQNNYVLFSAGGLDFVSVGLSYGVTPDEAQWASDVFARYPDRNGILMTHAYLAPSAAPDGRGATFSADGNRLYQQVVEANPNVFLVLAGHEHGVGTNVKSGIGAEVHHNVVELLADYQFYKVTAGELFPGKADAQGNIDLDGDGVTDRKATDALQFGASFMRLLQFDVEKSQVSIDTYSPMLDNFGATEYDDRKRYNGSEDNLVLPVDLSSRSTSFATDALSVVTPGDEVIGETTARSGWPGSVTWDGLEEGKLYAWSATSRTAGGDEIGTSNQTGGIFVATAAGTDVTAPVLTIPENTSLTEGDAFDPMTGVSARDNTDGDVTGTVKVTGSVDTTAPGSYALTYLATDTNGNQTIASRAVTVTKVPEVVRTATSVTSQNAAVVFGNKLTLSAQVTPREATGDVSFIHGEEVWCSGALTGGRATCSPLTLPAPGTYVVRAVYAGDATHAPSEQAIAVEVKEATSTLTVAPVKGTYGTATPVRVTVRGATSGTVTLKAGARALASGRVRDGQVSLSLPARALAPGRHALTLTHSGGNGVAPATGQVTAQIAKASSRSVATARRTRTGAVKVTVQVRSSVSGLTASGKVRVRVAGTTRTVALSSGRATLTLKAPRSVRTVKVSYLGDRYSAGSSATTTVR